jgi:flagellar biosynthesis/type III secretory pathway chaperone
MDSIVKVTDAIIAILAAVAAIVSQETISRLIKDDYQALRLLVSDRLPLLRKMEQAPASRPALQAAREQAHQAKLATDTKVVDKAQRLGNLIMREPSLNLANIDLDSVRASADLLARQTNAHDDRANADQDNISDNPFFFWDWIGDLRTEFNGPRSTY